MLSVKVKQKIVVLGSTSFAGGCFVKKSLDSGFDVLGISRSREPIDFFCPYANHKKLKNYTFEQVNINTSIQKLIDLVDHFKPDYIVDFAGQGMVEPSWAQPWQWYTTNLTTKSKLIDHLTKCKFLKKYIRISTPEVYGDQDNVLTENSSYMPSTPYAISHAAIDYHLKAYNQQFDFPMILGRFANFYGPTQQLYRIVPRTILSILSKEKLPLHGGGHSRRAFIHGDDVASGILRMIENGITGRTYHFSSEELISIRGLVEVVCNEMGVNFTDVVNITKDRLGKDMCYEMSFAQTKDEISWCPNVSLRNGLEECINWITLHYETISELSREYLHKE